jgi:hypothetical protein
VTKAASHHSEGAPLEAILTLERGALGASILDVSGRQAAILCEFVSENDWVSSLHRSVFRAIRSLLAQNSVPLDYCAICTELIKQGVYQSYANCASLIAKLGEDIRLARPMTRRIADLRGLWKSRKAEAVAQ